LKTDQTYDSA